MNERVYELISVVAKKSVEEIKASPDEEGLWDSLLHVELVVALETEYGIFFDPEEIAEISTPQKVLTAVEAKVASSEA